MAGFVLSQPLYLTYVPGSLGGNLLFLSRFRD